MERKSSKTRNSQEIDKGLGELLQDGQAPLVLAGVGYLLPIYRAASDYSHLAEQGVEGNPEELSDEALHRQAREIVQPLFTQAQGFKMAATTEHSSELIVDIQDIPVTGSDGQALMPTIERVTHHVGVAVKQVIGDGAYGSVANRVSQAT